MSRRTHRLSFIGRQLAPLTIGLIVAALCLYQGRRERTYKHKKYREAFPFSHYPMYSGFDPFDFVVFLAAADGTPLPLETLTGGLKANALKKKFDDLIDDLKDEKGKSVRNRDATAEQMRPAGEKILRSLCVEHERVATEATKGPVQLYQIRIEMKDGAVTESAPILIARYQPANS